MNTASQRARAGSEKTRTEGEEKNEEISNESTTAKKKKAKKHPCGKCDEECKANEKAVICNSCEIWFHSGCVEGMTSEFFDNCQKTYDLFGHSAFLCKICRKVMTKFTKKAKEQDEKIEAMNNRLTIIEREKDAMMDKIKAMEMKTEQVKSGLGMVEKEVENGMEKAKEEVKREVKTEMTRRDERSENLVIYGLAEITEGTTEQKQAKEMKKLGEIAKEIGVEIKGETSIKYRAGKVRDDGKARPLIVKIADEESRTKMVENARKLARSDNWKSLHLARPNVGTERARQETGAGEKRRSRKEE
jgi:hypothetical protein